MSLTADGEFFKCDMCGTYFHMNIFCSHRRQCKGLDSQEMKKELIAEVQGELDKGERERLAKLGCLNTEFKGELCGKEISIMERERRNAPLERQQAIANSKKNAAWQRKIMEEEDAKIVIPDELPPGFLEED
eukprot:TRINITY_DN16559_c0_g1_i1.p1 TRINITY_DN16559_c0_g1~~TRINITY_DN16559_c0_g1_i1.p1  ORF type:complete len:132 (+),score=45.41 TRINITY_DN16559_c0_g1_i1:52-447(+)